MRATGSTERTKPSPPSWHLSLVQEGGRLKWGITDSSPPFPHPLHFSLIWFLFPNHLFLIVCYYFRIKATARLPVTQSKQNTFFIYVKSLQWLFVQPAGLNHTHVYWTRKVHYIQGLASCVHVPLTVFFFFLLELNMLPSDRL